MHKIVILSLLTTLLSGCGSFWELVMTDDERRMLRHSAKNAAACQVTKYLQAPMWHKSLYQWNQGFCEAVPLRDEYAFGQDEEAPRRHYYSDILCTEPIEFQLTRYHSFCNQYALPQRLGNDVELVRNQAWTLNPASRFRVPLVKQYGFDQPFMTARIYHRIEVTEKRVFDPESDPLHLRKGTGMCELQMRIYKANPVSEGGKSLLMFHGGGGHQRSFHLLALESRIPEYTEQGYTVYLPFYRLMERGDTNIECSDASWQEMKTDAEKALHWVATHQTKFGDLAGKVTLFAQGSGGLLAGWLHTQKSDKVARSIMFYPVLDTASMRKDVLAGTQYEKGRELLERLFGEKLEQVSDSNPVLQQTSYWKLMAKNSQAYPPMVLLHGLRDQRVPYGQTLGSCMALSNSKQRRWDVDQSTEIDCGSSKAHLLAGAEYQLDYCFTGVECPAGDEQSREKVEAAIAKAHKWLQGVDE